MSVVAAILALLACLIFLVGVLGFIYPPMFKHRKTGAVEPRWKFFLGAWFGPVLPGAIAGAILASGEAPDRSSTPSPMAHTAQAQAAEPKALEPPQPPLKTLDLGITPEQFRTHFNQVVTLIDRALRIPSLRIETKNQVKTFQRSWPQAYMVGEVDLETGQMSSLVTGITGSSDFSKNLSALTLMLAMGQAVCPQVKKEQTAKMLMGIMQPAMKEIDDPDAGSHKDLLCGLRFTAFASRALGLVVSVSAAEN